MTHSNNLVSVLTDNKIRRFRTVSNEEGLVEVRILFEENDSIFWLSPKEGHYFEAVWVNTGKSHDAASHLSQEVSDFDTLARVSLHCSTHVLSMFDIRRTDGGIPDPYAMELWEECDD